LQQASQEEQGLNGLEPVEDEREDSQVPDEEEDEGEDLMENMEQWVQFGF
jgi:hypothetical protein